MSTPSTSDTVSSFLDSQVRRSCSWLLTRGYTYEGVQVLESKLIDQWVVARYLNSAAHREIEVSYSRRLVGMYEGLYVRVCGENNASFSLDDYLAHKGVADDAKSKLSLAAYEGSSENRVTAALIEIQKLLELELPDVLSGKSWVDVPFDWQGYK
jgi:hypothetical protein